MRSKDIERVIEIENESFNLPWSQGMFQTEISAPKNYSYFIVAENNGDILGYAGMWKILNEAHIGNLAVSPKSRKQGVGSALLSAIYYIANRIGANRAILEVRVSNLAAIDLYEKFGMKPAAIRKRYYLDNNEDALIMMIDNIPQDINLANIELDETSIF